MMQVGAPPSPQIAGVTLYPGAFPALTLRAVSYQSQNVAAEVVVAHAHTDWNNLDAMTHKRKDGTK